MKEIFNSYNVSELRKLASGYNKKVKIVGASKMKKPELVEALLKHKEHFKDLKMKEVKKPTKPTTKPTTKQTTKPQPKAKLTEEQKKQKSSFFNKMVTNMENFKGEQQRTKLVKPTKSSTKQENNNLNAIENNYNLILNYLKSPSKRNINYLKDIFNQDKLIKIFQSRKLTDFYPTPKMCIKEAYKFTKGSKNIFETGTGLGFTMIYLKQLHQKANITGIEIDDNLQELGNNLLKGSGLKIEKKNFFNVPNKTNYDYIFCNPPFTSGATKKDNFYLKFMLKCMMIGNETSNCYFQIIIPSAFIKEKKGDTINILDILYRAPQTTIKKYCKELNIDYNDLDNYDFVNGEVLGKCKFDYTNFDITNLIFKSYK